MDCQLQTLRFPPLPSLGSPGIGGSLLEDCMKEIPHGITGYSSYKCRCSICKIAKHNEWIKYFSNPENRNKRNIYGKNYRENPINKIRMQSYFSTYHKSPKGKKMHSICDAKRYSTPFGRLKLKTRKKTRDAIKKGEIIKTPCEKCGNIKTQAHHIDYNKPFDIKWLCRKCHAKEHKK